MSAGLRPDLTGDRRLGIALSDRNYDFLNFVKRKHTTMIYMGDWTWKPVCLHR